jgi:hypothetical protein
MEPPFRPEIPKVFQNDFAKLDLNPGLLLD